MILSDKNFSYSFDTNACAQCQGNCCTGESGYIWINKEEIRQLAKLLGISKAVLIEQYLVKVGYRFSIKEKHHEVLNHCCIFFDTEAKKCSVYHARPKQCKTFPFWDYFKHNIIEVQKECPGIITNN